VCYYHDLYDYSALSLESHKRHAVYVRFNVTKEGIYYITINQKNQRRFKRLDSYDYSPARLLLAKVMPDGNFKYYGAACKKDAEVFVGENLSEGTYIAYCKIEWIGAQNTNDFVLSVYGPQRVELEKLDKKLVPELVSSAMKSYASSSAKLKSYENIG
jgi:calpain-15